MLSTVSIMPGMENLAPDRDDTRRGFSRPPNFLPVACSIPVMATRIWSHRPSGI
jgi:hypothetical protein